MQDRGGPRDRWTWSLLLCSAWLLCGPAALDDAHDPALDFRASQGRGTLVICGGGHISDDVLREFVAAAGGQQARIVIITTATDTAETGELDDELAFWRNQRVASLEVLHTRSRAAANDPAFTEPLSRATGVWFVGGQQARLADTFVGTTSERLLHDVLRRGGAVGGISAGAAVMSPVMIRAGRVRPQIGRGFGLLPGTVIDQHFLTRNRQERLLEALAAHPGLVGLGIDEGAAVVVRGGRLSVVGDSHVVACLSPSPGREPRVETLKPGTSADLRALSLAANKPRQAQVHFRRALKIADSTGD